MNKNAIKKYAIWARRELIDRVSKKALRYGITPDGKADPKAESVNGELLSDTEKKQRSALIKKIADRGYEQTIEEVAYTWFNRFAALRFMEVNGYLPSHVRVFTNDAGEFKPQILAEAIHLDMAGLDMEKVYALKEADNTEELYRYLIIVQCNALSEILPGMFQRIEDFTELLLPDNLLREGSVIERLVKQGESDSIPEEDWRDQVQIIGWLYQYYNTEPKDKVFADLKKNIKVSKEKIPAATQLFTPDWIVRYMVENSLGRLWLEGHPNDTLKTDWKYYLDEAEQEPEVQAQLAEIRKEYAKLKPEDIRCIDPCMGSGHILCYMFDVLVKIYENYGYTAREAVGKIIENNLYGLDIDDRAAQLAYFAVMMKARQYDRRFFSRGLQPKVMAIQESNWIGGAYPYDMGDFLISKEHQDTLNYLLDAFKDAKEYGSILQLENRDYVVLLKAWEETAEATAGNFNMVLWFASVKDEIPSLIKQAIYLSQKYDVVVTNPPYAGCSNLPMALQNHIKKHYPMSKNDLFAVFIERSIDFSKRFKYISLVTMQSWMFLSSFEHLRKKLLNDTSLISINHLGMEAFDGIIGKVVSTVAFVLQKSNVIQKGIGVQLVDYYDSRRYEKEAAFFYPKNRFIYSLSKYKKIPGSPIAYWTSDNFIKVFDYPCIGDSFEAVVKGTYTGDNDRFLRLWYEVNSNQINTKWNLYSKGGGFRRWYGNIEYVILWEDNGKIIRSANPSGLGASKYFGKHTIVWTKLTTYKTGFRKNDSDVFFDDASPAFVGDLGDKSFYFLAYLNTCVVREILKLTSPTLNFQCGEMKQVPILYDDAIATQVIDLSKNTYKISHNDWDSFETSWDFERHPLVKKALSRSHWGNDESITIEYVSQFVKQDFEERFTKLKANEEELNRIFIETYGLQDELTPEVADKDVTVSRIYDTKEEIPESMKGNNYVLTKQDVVKSLISYAVGCMMGRYSLDVPGLAYAGGDWDDSKYKTFLPDKDAILPICDDEYFDDDIVARFVEFVKVVYGADTLEENLKFVADALGGKGTPREVIRNYFLSGFYADHVKTYQKRPIYWLFDSGKKNGLKCLVYMHRYRPDTIARIRTDYVHEQQSRYRTAMEELEHARDNAATTAERVKLGKKLAAIEAQAKELREYEEKIHHLADQMIAIDLDDGVKHNYAIFKDVLAKIK